MRQQWGTLKSELTFHRRYTSRLEAMREIRTFIELFFSRQRKQKRSGYLPRKRTSKSITNSEKHRDVLVSIIANRPQVRFNGSQGLLQQLDVFLYFTHRDWVESFGRLVLEAMPVWVPVIVPHRYKDLFGPAARYAKPGEVPAMVKRIIDDTHYRQGQVTNAFDYVEKTFGYGQHKRRLNKIVQKLSDSV